MKDIPPLTAERLDTREIKDIRRAYPVDEEILPQVRKLRNQDFARPIPAAVRAKDRTLEGIQSSMLVLFRTLAHAQAKHPEDVILEDAMLVALHIFEEITEERQQGILNSLAPEKAREARHRDYEPILDTEMMRMVNERRPVGRAPKQFFRGRGMHGASPAIEKTDAAPTKFRPNRK